MDIKYLAKRKEEVSKELRKYLDQEHFTNMRIYIDDASNEFLYMSTNLLDAEYIYNGIKIINPNFYNEFDYRYDETINEADGFIIFQQKGQMDKDNITFYTGLFLKKKAFFIVLETRSKYGIYESDSFDMCFDPIKNI